MGTIEMVYGTLKDVGLQSLYGRAAELHWIPSSESTMFDGTLVSGLPKVTVVGSDDTWAQGLVSSELTSPPITYGLRVKLLGLGNPDIPPTWMDFPDWKLWVPVGGGNLNAIADIPSAGTTVWGVEGDTIPALAHPGELMLNTLTSDLYRLG